MLDLVGEGAKDEGIAVFDLRGGRWRQLGVVASAAPSSLALDAGERFLYAVNEVDEYEGLPSGTVEAYAIDAADGNLKLVNRQKLSLSATAPRHAAVSPDGGLWLWRYMAGEHTTYCLLGKMEAWERSREF